MSKIKLAWRKISSPFRTRTPLQATKTYNNQESEGIKEVSYEKKKVTRHVMTKRVRGSKRFLLKKGRF